MVKVLKIFEWPNFKKKAIRHGGDTITLKTRYVFVFAISMLFVGLTFVTAVENQNSLNNGLNQDMNKMVGININTNQKLKTIQLNAKTIHKKFRHKVHARFHKKFRHKRHLGKFKRGKGRGDCWDNSASLYNSLSSTGVTARIVQYRTHFSPRHRSVQVLQNGVWTDFNYKGNGYARRYEATNRKPGLHVIKWNLIQKDGF